MRADLTAAALVALASLAVTACQPSSQKPDAPAPSVQEQLKARYLSALPRWMPIARNADGGDIAYDIDNRTFDLATKTAKVALQVRYAQPTTTEFPVEGGGSTTITYTIEQIDLTYKCADVPEQATFAIAERRVVDADGKVEFRHTTPPTDADFKSVSAWPMAFVAYRPACADR
jgi:hypothetical protein